MAAQRAGRHTPSAGDNVPGAQVAVDDVLDDDEPDVPDEDVEAVDELDEVDVLEVVPESDDDAEPVSFLPSAEPPVAGADELLLDARESVL